MRTQTRVLTLSFAAMLVVGACSSSATSSPAASAGAAASAPAGASSAASAAPTAGGTLYILQSAQEWDQLDPQRAYTGEDMAFFDGTIYRSLEAYTFSTDTTAATKLTPDLATDLGTATDGGKTWTFTLRDGITFQDGSPITCADVKYGISRTFATDVINAGPTYQIQYLDIPTDKDGSSSYKGPYKGTGQDLYDKAVTCSADNKTITFHLNTPLGDWNYATTLGMSPVPKAADTGETYGTSNVLPVSSGPYMVQSYTTGNGGKMILVRNPKWNQASDPYRHAYPDKWEVDFGIDPQVIDQRLIQSSGNDTTAMEYGGIQPANLSVIFADPKTPNPQFAGRALSDYDIYVRYFWIDTTKVPNVKIRQAMAVALDRAAITKVEGGDFFGTMADGLIKPNISDYAPTGLWDSLLGQKIPDSGDTAYAKQLIAESGQPAPALTYDYAQTPTADKVAAIVISSLGAAGFKVTPNPIERGKYYSVVFTKSAHEFGFAGWGADWPRASTVIPPLLTVKGGWDLSRLDDPAYNAQVVAALSETDQTKQAADWQALNKLASQNMYTIPLTFELTQRLAGTKVGGVYLWAPYGSWPYGDMYVKQ